MTGDSIKQIIQADKKNEDKHGLNEDYYVKDLDHPTEASVLGLLHLLPSQSILSQLS